MDYDLLRSRSSHGAGLTRRQTPLFIVTSSGRRVGKTLIARTLIEYFDAQRRPASAFDLNPDDYSLVDQMPICTEASSIGDTRGEIALFDRLVTPDEVPKVVDVAHDQIGRFFSIIQQIEFETECQRRAIVPMVLFIADTDGRACRSYTLLNARLPELPLVAVLNEAVPHIVRHRGNFPPTRRGGAPVIVPALSPALRSIIARPGFSFVSYAANATDTTAELYEWTRKLFLAFHDLEIRLLLGGLQPRPAPLAQHTPPNWAPSNLDWSGGNVLKKLAR